jgi:hypothetical protein
MLRQGNALQETGIIEASPLALVYRGEAPGRDPDGRALLLAGALVREVLECTPDPEGAAVVEAFCGAELTRFGDRLLRLTLLDLFPQTCHVESVSLWKR